MAQQRQQHDSALDAITAAIEYGHVSPVGQAVEICYGDHLRRVEFAALVRAVLQGTQLTLEEAAEHLGCSASTLKKWRYGQNRPWPGRGLRHAVADLVRLYGNHVNHGVTNHDDPASLAP